MAGALVYDASGSLLSGALERLTTAGASVHAQVLGDGGDGLDLTWQLTEGTLDEASVTVEADRADARYLVLFHATDQAGSSSYAVTTTPGATVTGTTSGPDVFLHTSRDLDAVAGATGAGAGTGDGDLVAAGADVVLPG